MNEILSSVAGLPAFLLYFALALVLVAAFLVIYMWVTPYDELTLIRGGDTAAAISLSGALIGFVLPLASAIAHSVSWLDMIIWGAIALVVQLAVFFIVSRVVPQLSKAISDGGTAQATLLAAASVGIGIVNAACMST
jgi:putative membrane protein